MPLAPTNPSIDEEEETQPVVQKPRIGTTGGEIPEQQSEIDARQPVQWAVDPMERKAQIQGEIEKRRKARFEKEHPFTPSSWQPAPPRNAQGEEIPTREARQFEAAAEEQAHFQQQSARAAEIQRRQQQIEQQRQTNNQLEAEYRGTGQQFYTDAHGRIQPVIDAETKRPLFNATGWEPGTHPKTGRPALTMRDKYGQRQFKEAPVVASLDPNDDQMYYKMPDGTTVAAGPIEEFTKSPNYAVAKTALAARTRNIKETHRQALQPIKLLADQAFAQLEQAKVEIQGLDAEIEKTAALVANTEGTPLGEGYAASLQQLQQRRDALDAQTKPRGDLARRAARARAGYTIASATAMREAFVAQQDEIAARVKATGKKLENDATYIANLKGMQSADEILRAANAEFGATEQGPASTPVAQPTEQAPAGILEQGEPFAAAERGVKNIGSVSTEEFARRYGDGRGPVKPASLVKLVQRSREIEELLASEESQLNATMQSSMQAEKEYIDALYKQRFARLTPEQQERVTNATTSPGTIKGTAGSFKRGVRQAENIVDAASLAAAGNIAEGAAREPEIVAEERKGDRAPVRANFDKFGESAERRYQIALQKYNLRESQREDRLAGAKRAVEGVQKDVVPALAKNIARRAREIDAIPQTEGKVGYDNAKGIVESLAAVGRHPIDTVLGLAAESIPSSVPSLTAAAAGSTLGPGGTAAGAGLGSFATEVGSTIMSELQKAGADFDNPESVDAILDDPKKMQVIYQKAVKRGVPVAIMDALSAGLAGRLLRAGGGVGKKAIQGAGEAAIQAGTGAAGELGGQLASGEKVDWKDVLSEALGELGPGGVEVATGVVRDKVSADSKTTPPAPPENPPASGPAPTKPTAPREPTKDQSDRIAKLAEEAANLSPEEAEARFTKLEAEIRGEIEQESKSAAESAEIFAKTATEKSAVDSAAVFEQKEAEYQKNPLVADPERRAKELRADLEKLDAEWAQHVAKVGVEAADAPRRQALEERRDAIEQQLVEADRVRQSAKGGADLKNDLAAQAGAPTPPAPKKSLVIDTINEVAPLDSEGFAAWEKKSGGQTETSNRIGIAAIGKPDEIAALKKAGEAARAEWRAAMNEAKSAPDSDFQKVSQKLTNLASKEQFFAEAISAAEGTGSALQDKEVVAAHAARKANPAPKSEAATLLEAENFEKEWKAQGAKAGSENQVVIKNGRAYKRNYSSMLGQATPMHGSIEKFREHIALRQQIFPESDVKIEGMSETSDGPAPVTSEKEVKGSAPTVPELRDFMAKKGFVPAGGNNFINEETGVRVNDLKASNVVKTADGQIYVTDPVIERVKKSAPAVTAPVASGNPKKDAAPISAAVSTATPETVEGDKLNKNWTAFTKESGSLGIPRAEMPQIKSEHRGALVNFLKGRGIPVKSAMVIPDQLKPTQAEFSPGKVQKAREYAGSERPILISSDGHLVDGHHQWMAGLQDDPKTPMPVLRIDAPIDRVLAEVKEFPSTQTAAGVAAKAATKEPSVSAPATKPLSDRAIEYLKSKKIDTRGKLFDVTGATAAAAYNAAIELAILGVRAGRAIADVVKLAVDRYKAKHPGHTKDDIAKLEVDIRSAIENRPPEPTPGQAKSKAPESLREVGVPAKDIEYTERNQNERMAEARAEVAKDPRKAELMIGDRDLPPDTRVAIGGVLLEKKMEAMKTASPDEIVSLTRDIQRITAATRAGVSTESGQGVAMHNKIYQNLAVGAVMEYTRDADKQRVEKMGGEEAVAAAQEAADEFNKTKDQAARDKAIDKLKDKYTTKPARRMLDQLKRIEVAKELNSLGVLTRDDMLTVAGNALGIPGISKEKLKHIAEIAGRAQNQQLSHADRSKADLELADMLQVYKGVNPLDLEASILTLNILSGPTTQAANLEGNALNLLTQLGTTAAVNPAKLGPIMKGLKEGIPLGWDQAKSIIMTGRGTRDFQDRTLGAGNALANVDYARDYGVNSKASAVLNTRARAVEKISRFMKAADAVFYYPAREAYARLVATKLLEGKFQGTELAKQVSEALHTTPAAFDAARKQAMLEGYSGVDLGRRVADIIEEKRGQSDAGKMAVKESERFAAEATFNNEPVGLAGVIYRNLARTVKDADVGGVPVLKPWAMFLRVPANVFNATTNFTPLGASRAFFGVKGEKYRKGGTGENQWRNYTKDERNRLYLQSVVGTTLMAALAARAINDKDDEFLTASGPSDPNKRRQLQAAGWNPYSIKVGDRWISYKDSPLLVPLAIVGHVADSLRYQKAKSDMVLGNQVVDAVSHAPNIIFQTSMLSGLSDLMSSLSGKGDISGSVTRTMGSIPANLVIPYNRLFQQIDQTFDSNVYKDNPITDSVPFLRRSGEQQFDVQGRPRTYEPSARFTTTEKNDPVDTILREKNIFISEPSKDTKIGNEVMTDEQYNVYRKLSGQRIRARLKIEAPRLRIMNQEQAQKRLEQISREERERVRPLVGARR